jgi:hypothetical protein
MGKSMGQSVQSRRDVISDFAVEKMLGNVLLVDEQAQVADRRPLFGCGILGVVVPFNRMLHVCPAR